MYEEAEIEIPAVVPAITLPDTVLFPHAILPLYIFEPRYRQMLEEVLESNRLMAVVKQDENAQGGMVEPPHEYATLGVIRAAHKNDDGTSNLVLQGIARIRILEIVEEEPYRQIKIDPIQETSHASTEQLERLQEKTLSQLKAEEALLSQIPEEFMDFLRTVEDPVQWIDLLSYSICSHADVRQQLLEAIEPVDRFEILDHYLAKRLEQISLNRLLQGKTRDDEIGLN